MSRMFGLCREYIERKKISSINMIKSEFSLHTYRKDVTGDLHISLEEVSINYT